MIDESNGDEVKGTELAASEPRLRNSEAVVEDQSLCRSKYFGQYLPRLTLPSITFEQKIDLDKTPTFEDQGLLTTHAQYRIQDKNNEYVDKVGIFWKSINCLEVVGWRHT